MNTTPDNNIIDGAITEIKKPDNALVIMDPLKFATELFQPYHDQLTVAKRKASRVKYDVTTKDGMAEAKELRATFVSIRTTADKAKTEAKRPIDQSGKLILEHYRKLEEAAKAEEAKHDKAIKDEEARIEAEKQRKLAEERARIEAIEGRIAHIRSLSVQLAQADSATLSAKVEELATKRLDPAMYDEHLEDAVNALNATVDALRVMYDAALAREAEARRVAAEREELARLKAEQADREQAEKEAEAERQRQMAEMRAQQEAAAAALAKQQAQMTAIMEIQGLAAALTAAGDDRSPKAIEAALEKAVAFNPDDFGAMTAMAKMARDAVVPLLENLLLNAPLTKIAPVVADTREIQVSPAAPLDLVDEPAQYVAPAVLREPMRVDPASTAPPDDEIIELVANTYGESFKTALDWLAAINFARAYDKLSEKA